MVTKRVPIRREGKIRISTDILDAYARVNQLHGEAKHEDEFREADMRLHSLLGRKPWQAMITDTFDCDEPPSWLTHQEHIADWREAIAIRQQLDTALIERGWPKYADHR